MQGDTKVLFIGVYMVFKLTCGHHMVTKLVHKINIYEKNALFTGFLERIGKIEQWIMSPLL